MAIKQARSRQLHYIVAPIIVLPILISLTTGLLYQIADLSGKDDDFKWLLEAHKGNFGIINLELIYPFLNLLGLLTLAVTGISMWFWEFRHPARSLELD